LLLGMLPWTLLIPSFVKFVGRRSVRAAARRPAALGFFLLAFLWCLLFYSAAGCKRAGYILPALPPLALALGCYVDVAIRRRRAALRLASARLWKPLERLAYRATLLVLTLGIGGCVLASYLRLQPPDRTFPIGCAAALGLLYLLRCGPLPRLRTSWGLCGGTFTLLFAAVHQLLPGYARRFSLRAQVQPHQEISADPHVPVVCYPRRWDSVSFYLRRNDVQTYPPDQRDQLIAALLARPNTLLFVKSELHLKELLHHLPGSLEFIPYGRQGTVTAGLVQRRAEAPPEVVVVRR